jgi:hypothetical protein
LTVDSLFGRIHSLRNFHFSLHSVLLSFIPSNITGLHPLAPVVWTVVLSDGGYRRSRFLVPIRNARGLGETTPQRTRVRDLVNGAKGDQFPMNTGVQKLFADVITLDFLGMAAGPIAVYGASRQSSDTQIVSNGQIAGVAAGIAGAGAAIGIGVFYAVHHGHSLTGCTASGSSGLELVNEGDHETWALVGEVSGIKPGQRVRVSGKKEKKDPANVRQFLVEKASKDLGPCDGGRPGN